MSGPSLRWASPIGCSAAVLALGLVLLVGTWYALWLVPFRWLATDQSQLNASGLDCGWMAAWVGDADGDGTPDLALRTPCEPRDARSTGRTRLVSGADGHRLAWLDSQRSEGWNQFRLGAGGDLNGDGRDDTWCKPDPYTLLLTWFEPTPHVQELGTDFSDIVAPLGDVNGDGAPEFLVGGFPEAQGGADALAAVSVRDFQVVWIRNRGARTIQDRRAFSWWGCVPGDVDRDGVLDAAYVDGAGRIRIVDGRTGFALRDLDGVDADGWVPLAPLGDVDGDGVPELLARVGRYGPVRVVSCANGRELARFPDRDADLVQGFFSPGDCDGDGAPDVALSAVRHGRAVLDVLSGRDGRHLLGVTDVCAWPGSADWNHDGCADLLVTRNVHLPVGASAPDDLWRQGRVEILDGRTGQVLRAFDGSILP